jgi:hypothetical protein
LPDELELTGAGAAEAVVAGAGAAWVVTGAGVGVGVGVVLVLAACKNSAASEEDGVGDAELGAGITVEMVSPIKTYIPFAIPASTTSYGIAVPSRTYSVVTGPATIVVTTSRPCTGEPCLFL